MDSKHRMETIKTPTGSREEKLGERIKHQDLNTWMLEKGAAQLANYRLVIQK